MIASIRVLNEGNFDYLCELDIMKHSQDQIVARLKELGIDKGNFFVCVLLIGKLIRSCRWTRFTC